jgi:hypothetical protein
MLARMEPTRKPPYRRTIRRARPSRRIAWEQVIGPLVGALLTSLPAWVGHVRWG